MNENIVLDEEMVEVVDDYVTTNSGNGLKKAGIGLAIVGLAYGGFKLFKKLKSKKENDETIELTNAKSMDEDDEDKE